MGYNMYATWYRMFAIHLIYSFYGHIVPSKETESESYTRKKDSKMNLSNAYESSSEIECFCVRFG